MSDTDTITALCECGCGLPAPISSRTDSRVGAVRGQPRRYIQYHNGYKPTAVPVTVICDNCGQPLLRLQSAMKYERLFCSRPCKSQFLARGMMNQTPEQFWARVAIGKPDECWEWQGCHQRGYGQSAWMGKRWLAHRLALSLTDGDWDSPLHVLHRCDNPPCCNPAHLWRGTDADNISDMRAKGRQNDPRGEANHSTRLTKEQVAAIRQSSEGIAALSRQYSVSAGAVSAIRHGRSWRHIP